MIIKQDWKHRNNDTSNLTVAQLIEETIREETDKAIMENSHDKVMWGRGETQAQKTMEQAHYRAIAILQELL